MTEEFETEIVLDDRVRVIIKIPRQMTATEFRGLTMLSTKLMNISQSNLREIPTTGTVTRKWKSKKNGYTVECDKRLVYLREKKDLSWSKIAKTMSEEFNLHKVPTTWENRYKKLKVDEVTK